MSNALVNALSDVGQGLFWAFVVFAVVLILRSIMEE